MQAIKPLYWLDEATDRETGLLTSELTINPHYGQSQALNSKKRIVAIIAGTQSGKTEFLPLMLLQEIQRRGPGDYGFVSPTFTLMELKALPAFRKLFETTLQLGEYSGSPVRKFTVSELGDIELFDKVQPFRTVIYFGYAANPDSLESATFKAVCMDEAGQKDFKRESWEALLRRVAIHHGRIFIGTTPYSDRGWLRTEIVDRFREGDPDIDVIGFDSTMNPAFPKDEYERARRQLPKWKFDLFYRGIMTRPAGAIFDSFDPTIHKVPRFLIPAEWKRYIGLDFGGVNTAAVLLAKNPDADEYYLYREYWPQATKIAADHVRALRAGEPKRMPYCVGGSKGEAHWREQFAADGLNVREPDITGPDSVEVGIQLLYAMWSLNKLFVFNDCTRTLDQIETYSRETDDMGNVLDDIDDKESFHLVDALRYLATHINKAGPHLGARGVRVQQPKETLIGSMPRGVFNS